MTYENNEKYIMETWLENPDDAAFKKAFLMTLLDQVQGHEHEFDADTVDGKHYQDISNEMDEKVSNLVSNFSIGHSKIDSETIQASGNGMLFLGFEGVKLFLDNGDSYYDERKRLPWSSEDKTESPDILQAFEELYEIVQKKLDTNSFDEYTESVAGTLNDVSDLSKATQDNIQYIYNEEGEIIGSNINATSINGLRVFVRTKSQYESMKQDPKGLAKINNIHNLFILKEDGVASDFDDALLAEQPDTAPINSYYKFQISEPREEVDDNGNVIVKRYLQYRHSDSPNWHDMADTADFIDDSLITNKVISSIESADYSLNISAVLNALKQIEFDDSSDYTLPKYIRNSGARGAVSHNFKPRNAINDYLPIEQSSTGQPFYINLDGFGQEVISKINTESISPMNTTISSIQETLNSVNSLANTNKSNIDLIKDGTSQTGNNKITLKTLNENISLLNTNVSGLLSDINKIKDWKTEYIGDLVQKIDSNTTYKSSIYYNKFLGIAYLYIRFVHYHDKDFKNDWVYPIKSSSKNGFTYYDADIAEYDCNPPSTYTFPSSKNPNRDYIMITDGSSEQNSFINVWCGASSSGKVTFQGSLAYRIRRG